MTAAIRFIKTHPQAQLPSYQSHGAAGMDLVNVEQVILSPGERRLVDIGLKIAIPPGYEGQVRPRSGLAAKHGITVLNAPGTIDSDYRGPVKVLLVNHGIVAYAIQPGDRIAQLVIAPVAQVTVTESTELEATERGEGGFGSTGVGSGDESRRVVEAGTRGKQAVVLSGTGKPPEDTSYQALKSNGQQQDYLVLDPAERAKGFVRPLRWEYKHVGPEPPKNLRDLTPDEVERYSKYGYVKYEEYPESEGGIMGRFWTQAMLDSLGGCGIITRMGRDIAETFARDPEFYGASFCCGCGKHLYNEEFVWVGTTERVGS